MLTFALHPFGQAQVHTAGKSSQSYAHRRGNMTTENHRRAFISYSRVNKEFAIKLARELRSAGYPVWFDQFDIPTGSRWDDEVEKALRECSIFMIILTPASIASENVKDEIGYAIDHGKRILPVLLEDCDVPLRLRRFQWVDFTKKSFEEGFESAKDLLGDLIEEKSTPIVASAAPPPVEAKPAPAPVESKPAPIPVKPAATAVSKPETSTGKKPMNKWLMIGGGLGVLVIVLCIAVFSIISQGWNTANTPPTETLPTKVPPTKIPPTTVPPTQTLSAEIPDTEQFPDGYQRIFDDSQTISMVVPEAWKVERRGKTDDGKYIFLYASENESDFQDFTADGVFLYVSSQQTWSVKEELDTFTNIPSNCIIGLNEDYNISSKYRGSHRLYNCNTEAYFLDLLALRPINDPQEYIIAVELHIVSDELKNFFDPNQFINSIEVTGPLP
ncbi:MAG: TIR domain-containing protein [Chloroflexi bacterium]|nr:MAG: TIR domain-containing protein [Chloroflexota bacterium]